MARLGANDLEFRALQILYRLLTDNPTVSTSRVLRSTLLDLEEARTKPVYTTWSLII